MKRNKFGVPYRWFALRLADGRTVTMDVGCEEDWGCVQPCRPDDCPDWETAVGWGNDADSHVKIVWVQRDFYAKPMGVKGRTARWSGL